MLTSIAIGAAGVVILVTGGELLVKNAASLARRLGISPLAVGLTIVAFGTSAPELAVSIGAALSDSGTLAFGNIFGSNLANIGLIVGLSALVLPLPIDNAIIRRELPMMLLATAAAMVMAFDIDLGETRNVYTRSDGLVLLLFFGVFLWYTLGDLLRQRGRSNSGDTLKIAAAPVVADGAWAGSAANEDLGHSGIAFRLVLIALGLVGLAVGGNLVVTGAVDLARALGVPEVVVGLTVVAVGTSLPELAASLSALRRREVGIAVGGVVGSNIFNTLLVTGTTATIRPMPIPEGGHLDLAATAVLSLALVLFARSNSQKIIRYEGLGLLLLWAGYLTARTLWLSP